MQPLPELRLLATVHLDEEDLGNIALLDELVGSIWGVAERQRLGHGLWLDSVDGTVAIYQVGLRPPEPEDDEDMAESG